MTNALTIFVVSITVSGAFWGLERLAGISHGFHPDSLYYMENSWEYVVGGLFSLSAFNNLYYHLVHMLDYSVVGVITLNQFVFAATNALLYRYANKGSKLSKQQMIFLWVVLLLPYRMHLAAHVLKDTILIFLTVLSFTGLIRFFPFVVILLCGFRIVAGPLAVLARFTITRPWFLALAYSAVLIVVAVFPAAADFLSERNEADMGGREYFAVPLQYASGIFDVVQKSLLWPILAKTGLFAGFNFHPFTLILAFEPMFFMLIAAYHRRLANFFLSPGILSIVLISLLVTSFGAYYRYIYPFLIIDYLFLIVATTPQNANGIVTKSNDNQRILQRQFR